MTGEMVRDGTACLLGIYGRTAKRQSKGWGGILDGEARCS